MHLWEVFSQARLFEIVFLSFRVSVKTDFRTKWLIKRVILPTSIGPYLFDGLEVGHVQPVSYRIALNFPIFLISVNLDCKT